MRSPFGHGGAGAIDGAAPLLALLPALAIAGLLGACGSSPAAARGAAPGSADAALAHDDTFAPPPVVGQGAARPAARPAAARQDPRAQRPQQRPGPAAASMAPTVVTWEALAVERAQFENSRYRRNSNATQTQKIVLVNESHPDAKAARIGRAGVTRDGVAVAAVPEDEMRAFLQALQQAGFYRAARPTTALEPLFEREEARGRITVEHGGQSLSILSVRGQGLDPSTRHLPALYSDLKQSIAYLRNSTPTLTITSVDREPLR